MPKIKYIEHNGKEHEVDVPEGWSVMEGAVKNLIPGIDADCGGACACATCHVYVEESWLSKLSPKEDMEETMLDFAQDLEPNSRLSCQIKVSSALDGFTVRMPKSQH
ncbi:MAG: (2Fe-2S)-binding protein [Alphaproteobacteria bacterium]|nr:(2Fe-2S)-binding protein [Alphaproteobacteria bacterium]